jgi:AcrR family transcriptional regulator
MVFPMEDEPRPLRADAERNRRRLIEAATEMFCERGLDVGVGEIAHQAGVGRGTLFRNFPSKDHLIAAVVVERINESVARARTALDADDPGEAVFRLIDQALERQQADRALFEALADTWMANPEIRAGHREMLGILDTLVRRAQDAGAVRPDVGAVDVLMLIKGVCEAARSFEHIDPAIGMRQLGLVRAALSAPGSEQHPLRGTPPTIEDLERAVLCATPTVPEVAPSAPVTAATG